MLVFFLKRELLLHKLRYSKTLKGDWAGAFLGLVISIFVGYLSLASLGASSIDLMDLVILFWYIFLFMLTIINLNANFCSTAPSVSIICDFVIFVLRSIRRWR